MTNIKDIKCEYLPNGERLFYLDNGIKAYYYNEDTPVIFTNNGVVIGRFLSRTMLHSDFIEFANVTPVDDVLEYFKNF